MSASRSRSSGPTGGLSTAERLSLAALSMSDRMDAFLAVVDLGPVGLEDLRAFGLVLGGEQAAFDAERSLGDDHPADLFVLGQRGVGQGELGRDGVAVGGFAGRRDN